MGLPAYGGKSVVNSLSQMVVENLWLICLNPFLVSGTGFVFGIPVTYFGC
jgi:hypothetical protein